VHPHLETMRIDLYQPVTELKTFLPVLFPGSDFARVKKLIDSLALSDVVVSEPGISLRVRLDVPDPQVSRSPQDREAVAQRGEAERSVGTREEGKASEDHMGKPALQVDAPKTAEPGRTPEEIARWESAWQSWDGFLTFLVKHSSKDAGDETRDQLRTLLLDARQDMSEILASTEPRAADPVRPLFLQTWSRLAPILRQISTPLPGEKALHYLSLITADDAFTALDAL